MKIDNKNLIREKRLDYWPQQLSFIVEAVLKAEPKPAREIVTRMDSGHEKRRPATTQKSYIHMNAWPFIPVRSMCAISSKRISLVRGMSLLSGKDL